MSAVLRLLNTLVTYIQAGAKEHDFLVLLIPVSMVSIGGAARSLIDGELSIDAFSLGMESCLVALTECLSSMHERLHAITKALGTSLDADEISRCVAINLRGIVLVIFSIIGIFLLSILEQTIKSWSERAVAKRVRRSVIETVKVRYKFLLGNALGSTILVSVLIYMKEAK